MNGFSEISFFYYSYKMVDSVIDLPEARISYVDLTYCIEGEMHYIYEGEEYILGGGDAILYPCGSVRIRKKSSVPTLYASLNVIFDEEISPAVSGVIRKSLRSDTISILESLKKSHASVSPERERKCNALFWYLYYQLVETAAYNENPHIKHIKRYIASHLYEQMRLSDIAMAVHLDPNYCSSLFSKCEGMSIFEFITARRIEVAKSLIAADYMQISEVAEKVGFSDSNYFSRAFRHLVGVSPSEWRRNFFSNGIK